MSVVTLPFPPNPLHVVHSVALLVLAAIAASHRPHKNGHDLFLLSRVASASTSGKYFNGYIGPHLTRFESTSKETLGDGACCRQWGRRR